MTLCPYCEHELKGGWTVFGEHQKDDRFSDYHFCILCDACADKRDSVAFLDKKYYATHLERMKRLDEEIKEMRHRDFLEKAKRVGLHDKIIAEMKRRKALSKEEKKKEDESPEGQKASEMAIEALQEIGGNRILEKLSNKDYMKNYWKTHPEQYEKHKEKMRIYQANKYRGKGMVGVSQ